MEFGMLWTVTLIDLLQSSTEVDFSCGHPASIVNQAELAELGQEMVDPRTRRADQCSQHFLFRVGDNPGVGTTLARAGECQQGPSQPLLDGTHKLVDQGRFRL